jgi:hypothetical protein
MMDFCRFVGCKLGGRFIVTGPQLLKGDVVSSAKSAIVRPIVVALVHMARMMFHWLTGRSSSEESAWVMMPLLTRSCNRSKIIWRVSKLR